MAIVNFPDPSASPWTNPDNGVTYEYDNGVWKVVGGGGGLDANYVLVAGDNMTGSLTFGPEGGPANTTIAASGVGTFSGDITSITPGTVAKTAIGKDGALGITRVTNNNDSALTVTAGGDLNVDVKASGAATFAGDVVVGGAAEDGSMLIRGDLAITGDTTFGDYGNNGGALIKSNGEATFNGIVKSTNYFHSEGNNPDNTAFYATANGAGNVIISHGGKGTFAGGLISGADPTGGANVGFQGNWSGVMRACRGDNANLFEGYTLGNSAATSQIKPDGSAEFAGNVTSTRLTVDAPGDTSRIQALVSNSTAATTGCLVVYNKDTTQSVVNITADGKVKAASFDLESLSSLQP